MSTRDEDHAANEADRTNSGGEAEAAAATQGEGVPPADPHNRVSEIATTPETPSARRDFGGCAAPARGLEPLTR